MYASPASDIRSGSRARFHPAVRVVLLVVVLLMALVLLIPLAALLEAVLPWEEAVRGAVVQLLMHLCAPVTALLLVRAYARWVERLRLRDLGMRCSRRTLPMLGLGTGIAGVLAFAAHFAAAGLTGQLRPRAIALPDEPALVVLSVVMLFVTQPFFLQGFPEELVFRGAMLRALGRRPVVAIVTSTLVFGAIHILSQGGQQNLAERFLYLPFAASFGFLAAVLTVLLRSMWVAVGVHGGFHVGGAAAMMLVEGQPGPVQWLCSIVLFSAAGIACLLVLRRRGGLAEPIVFRH